MIRGKGECGKWECRVCMWGSVVSVISGSVVCACVCVAGGRAESGDMAREWPNTMCSAPVPGQPAHECAAREVMPDGVEQAGDRA